MTLVKGMLLASMLMAMAGSAGAVEKAVDAADAGGGPGGIPLASLGTGMSANDEWACKVKMCMANPGGPTEFAECVDPIQRLKRHLAKGKPFPVCKFLGGGSDDNGGGQRGSTRRGTAGGGVDKNERDPLHAL